ncbi:MAG TPA: redoxin domain-containing protein [Natronosporangium sp.]|nr:redoxin domain-containing protein [Natronosporangium sp.]
MNVWNAALVALWVVVLLNLLLTYALIRRVGAGAGEPPLGGLEAGTTVPEFEAETPDGRRLSRRDLGERRALVLGFFSPTCSACTHHLPDFGTFSKRAQEKGVQAVAVVDGDAAQSEELRASLPAGTTTLLAPRNSNPLLDAFQVSAYPSYTVVRADGTVEGTYGQVRQLDARLARL